VVGSTSALGKTHAHALIAAFLGDGIELLLEPCEGCEAEDIHGYALLRASASTERGKAGVLGAMETLGQIGACLTLSRRPVQRG
jgi:hypothetical protein